MNKKQFFVALIVVVVMLSILAMIALASETTREDWFYHIFEKNASQQVVMPSENQQQLFSNGLICGDQCVTQNGYSITLDSSKFDGYRVILKFSVDGPEGMSFGLEEYDLLLETSIALPNAKNENFNVSYSTGKMLEDDDPNDSSFIYVWECIFHVPNDMRFFEVDETILAIHIDSIRKVDASKNTLIAKGSWDFTVKYPSDLHATNAVELLEKPIKCQAKRELLGRKFDVSIKLTSFQLRTLSATIIYDKPLTGFWDGIDLKPIFLVMNDGARVETQFKAWVNRGRYAECTYIFEQPVSFKDVAYVEFEV